MDGDRLSLADQCAGRWKSILPALGIHLSYLSGKNGPCPFCGGKDRWRWINRNGSGDWFCTQCEPQHGSGLQLAVRWFKGDFKVAARAIESALGEVEAPKVSKPPPWRQRAQMRSLWRSARRLREDGPDGIYLRSRGLAFVAPSCLRFSMDAPYDGKRLHPAILAAVLSAQGKPVNIHRLFITSHGTKTDLVPARKMMPGQVPAGSAIRLFKALGPELGVAEGVETALACAELFGIPVWSVMDAGNMAKFVPPEGVTSLVIFADNDTSYTGQAVAYALARHTVSHAKIDARVELAPDVGTDWNDQLFHMDRFSRPAAASVRGIVQAPASVPVRWVRHAEH